MKISTAIVIATLLFASFLVSCTKNPGIVNIQHKTERKFRFQLYTNENYSEDNAVIHFSIFIRNHARTIFDSALAPMRIKDIPDSTHKLLFEKTVLESNTSDLAAGFNYDIEFVGRSWYLDTSNAGNAFKIIDFAFR